MIKVIDASVGVKWFLNEPDSGLARELLEEMGTHSKKFVVPELFFYEVYAVCMRRHPNPERFASEGMGLLFKVPLTRVPMTLELSEYGQSFLESGLTGYDAVYAALAKRCKGCWVTYDKSAARRLKYPAWIEVLGGK